MYGIKKNRLLVLITFLILLASLLPLAAHADPTIPALTKQAVFTIGSNVVQVDGQSYQMDVAPYIDQNGRTQVPVRFLGDVLGMTAQWDGVKQQVTLTEQTWTGIETLSIGSNKLNWVNEAQDGSTSMDTTPVIVPPGRTMLPARWVAQAIGYRVTWNAANQTVTVSPQGQGGQAGQVQGTGTGNDGGVGQGSGVTPPYTGHSGSSN